MRAFRLAYGMPDLGAAVRALIDQVDLGHAPVWLDLPDIHRKQSDTAGADDRSHLDFMVCVMLYVGWHVGSPSQRKHVIRNPAPI
jgi:hypothetical protein